LPSLTGFSDRYAVASFSDGKGVLVDLSTGGYFRLNPAAVFVCEALQRSETVDGAVDLVAQGMRITSADAEQLVAHVQENLSQPLPRHPPDTAFAYAKDPDGSWVLQEDGRTIFSIADERCQVELQASLGELKGPLVAYLQALVPKLLALLDVPVLHAAACRIGTRHVAFSGKSGAGKTTTALTF